MLSLVPFLAQLALYAGARPGEVPRAAFERLTGLVLAGKDCGMPEMAGMDGAMPEMAGMGAMPEITGMDDMPRSQMAATASGPHQPGHDAQRGCFLCLFLELAPLMLASAVSPPMRVAVAYRLNYRIPAIRAPPFAAIVAAFPRGPPLF